MHPHFRPLILCRKQLFSIHQQNSHRFLLIQNTSILRWFGVEDFPLCERSCKVCTLFLQFESCISVFFILALLVSAQIQKLASIRFAQNNSYFSCLQNIAGCLSFPVQHFRRSAPHFSVSEFRIINISSMWNAHAGWTESCISTI